MNIQTARGLLTKSRKSMLDLVDQIIAAGEFSSTGDGTWTTIDFQAHIASWEKTMLEPLEKLAQSGNFQPESIPNHDLWNAEQADLWSQQSVKEIQEDYAWVRSEMLRLVDSVNPELLDHKFPTPWGDENTLPEMLSGLAWHEREHTRDLRKLFSKTES